MCPEALVVGGDDGVVIKDDGNPRYLGMSCDRPTNTSALCQDIESINSNT
jgi:hypothetical protein